MEVTQSGTKNVKKMGQKKDSPLKTQSPLDTLQINHLVKPSKKSHLKKIEPKEKTEKRNRRKISRKRKKSLNVNDQSLITNPADSEFVFKIAPVNSGHHGRFIRKRNTKCNKIRLKTFIVDRRPCVFESFDYIVKIFEKLKVKSPMTSHHTSLVLQNTPTTSSTPNKIKPDKKTKKNKKKQLEQEKKKEPEFFQDHFTPQQVINGLESGELIRGAIRINPNNAHDAYVNNQDPSLPDYYINSIVDRNRALDGDEVVLEIKPKNEWKKPNTPSYRVVRVEKLVNPALATGHLKFINEGNKRNGSEFAILFTRDKRMPNLRIYAKNWPPGFRENPESFKDVLILGELMNWRKPKVAIGQLVSVLGREGDLKVEELSLLSEACLDPMPHAQHLIKDVNLNPVIDPQEMLTRRDMRGECVFTIDPATARDLDDAVSVKELPNGNYEIGVHISDVAYYLKDGTDLDRSVAKKATTIYMIQNVYHMLPVEMCMHCSLLPGFDKRSFSVFWEITPNAEVLTTKFTRTVINSCAQLSYEHAQQMIEDPTKQFKNDELPRIHNNYTYKDLSIAVNVLQKIAVQLREKRVRNGCLKLDQVKLLFRLDEQTGQPLSFAIYENKEAHRLIEEFMLLANISVAERVHQVFPDIAFLRCHEPPKQTMMAKLQKNLQTYGIFVDISSSGKISSSLQTYTTDDEAGKDRSAVLYHLFSKPMTRARYFCASEQIDFSHFALSVPLYTHFTSPIRRYADIMVHRLLAASLGYCETPNWSTEHVKEVAKVCNTKKYNAKRAGDLCSDLYLAQYIENYEKLHQQAFVADAVVVDVKNASFDALVLNTGSIVRINKSTLPEGTEWSEEKLSTDNDDMPMYKVSILYPATKQYRQITLVVELFTHIKVALFRNKNNLYKLEAILLRPV